MPKKKHVTQKSFERKIKVWTAMVPLIVAVIGSLTAIGVAYLNKPRTEYKMSQDDQLEVNKLSAQINLLSERYFEVNDQTEKERLDTELRVLAETEATIMRKYNPNYRPRWPFTWQSRIPLYPSLIISLAAITVLGVFAHYAVKRILEQRYRKHLRDHIIEIIRRNSWGADMHEIIWHIRHEVSHYRTEDIEEIVRELEAEHKIETHNGRWTLIGKEFF